MGRAFIISDLHLGHEKLLSFKRFDGKPLRVADSIEEHHEDLITNINAIVGKHDRLYLAGDIVIKRTALPLLSRINGKKILIRGNHDIFQMKDYIPYFEDIRGSHKVGNHILSHIPIHPDSISRWCEGNVHGHLHYGWVPKVPKGEVDPLAEADTRYFNVSCEILRYKPIEISELVKVHNELKQHSWTIEEICSAVALS